MNDTLHRRKSLLKATAFLGLFMAGASLYGQQTFSGPRSTSTTRTTCPLTVRRRRAPANAQGFIDNYFVFRRAYFTYENKINDNLKFRFRTDAGRRHRRLGQVRQARRQDCVPSSSTSISNGPTSIPKSAIKIGMIDTLTFKAAEDRWGYRSVAKTLVDGYKDVTGKEIDATSADIGVSLRDPQQGASIRRSW